MSNYISVLGGVACGFMLSAALAGNAQAGPLAAQGAGQCLVFDGVDDFVGVPRSTSLEPDEFTIELWAWLDGPQDWNTRLLRKGLDDAYFITCDQDLDQRMQFMITRGHTISLQAKDNQPHTTYSGSWHHFLGVYAVNYADFWVDGVKVSSLGHGLGPMTHLPLTDLCIGAGLPIALQNEYFKGRIDEVRIWNYPRTPQQIAATWHTSVPANDPGLVAYWNFDEGSGQLAGDSSSSMNHGQLGATAAAESDDPTWMISDAPIGPLSCFAQRYCSGSPNSTGLGAAIDVSGSFSVGANDMHLLASGCPPFKRGIFFYGQTRVQYPFGDGYLCMSPLGPGLLRIPTPQTIDASGAVDLLLDIQGLPGGGAISGGSTWNFQFWYRDQVPGGSGFNLSDAMSVTFCP